jgi:DNA polymerase-3 subunit gamma/tau
MFYLKYRPQKFSELIKPNSVADALSTQVKTGKVSHAYLFTGSRGTGKTTTARILAKAVNCLKPEKNGDPCDSCENCEAIRKGSFLDLIEIDAASNRGIDDIRSLRDRIKLAPAHGKKKVYIIDEVHMLTAEAFNALLKTLEEPPAHAVFILCTTEASKVPDTIKSRCQLFNFKRASLKQLEEKMRKIVDGEGGKELEKKLEDSVSIDAAIAEIARASLGGYRDAETMLQQVLQGNLSTANLSGSSSYSEFLNFMNFLLDICPADALTFLEKKFGEGVDMFGWAYSLLDYLKSLLFIKTKAISSSPDIPEELWEGMVAQAERMSTQELLFVTHTFLDARNKVEETGIGTLPLELAVAEICSRWGGDGDRDNKKPVPIKKSPSPSVEEKPTKKKTSEEPIESSIDIDTLKKEWNSILRVATKYNHSVRALLKSTQPIEIVGNTVILEAKFAFHKDRLEYAKNREIVEQVFFEVLEIPLTFSCKLCESTPTRKSFGETGNLTDYNLVVPERQELSAVNIDASLLEVFDGGLPL